MKYEPDQQYNNRYRTERQGFWWWVIKSGTGTRSVLKAHTERGALELVQELMTAFRDGEFVGQVAADAKAQQWQLAVDQLLSGWHSTADSYASPHEAVKALIVFEVTAALDPKVSSDAEALVEQARREEREATDFLPEIEWAANGYCPVCCGWEVTKGRGCEPRVHRKDCKLAAAIRARGEGK